MKSKIVPPTADINEPIPNNRLIEVNGNQPPFAFVGFFLGGGGGISKAFFFFYGKNISNV